MFGTHTMAYLCDMAEMHGTKGIQGYQLADPPTYTRYTASHGKCWKLVLCTYYTMHSFVCANFK